MRARWRTAFMIAWLERYVRRCAANVDAIRLRRAQRLDFGMRLTATMMITLTERLTVPNKYGTNPRVRRRIGTCARSEFARAREVRSISGDYLTSTPFQNAT